MVYLVGAAACFVGLLVWKDGPVWLQAGLLVVGTALCAALIWGEG